MEHPCKTDRSSIFLNVCVRIIGPTESIRACNRDHVADTIIVRREITRAFRQHTRTFMCICNIIVVPSRADVCFGHLTRKKEIASNLSECVENDVGPNL